MANCFKNDVNVISIDQVKVSFCAHQSNYSFMSEGDVWSHFSDHENSSDAGYRCVSVLSCFVSVLV